MTSGQPVSGNEVGRNPRPLLVAIVESRFVTLLGDGLLRRIEDGGHGP